MQHPNSQALWARAQRVLAGGPATLSKHPARFPAGIAPAFLSHGDGAYVWDVDGHKYIDVIAGLGPILLGHDYLPVTDAVRRQAERMTSGSLPTAIEVEVAEQLVDCIPGAEQVRFASNGKDVTEAAVKLARHVTGKRHAIYVGYHGGFGDYLITTDKNGGVLPSLAQYNHQVPFGDTTALFDVIARECQDDLAIIMAEVPPFAWGSDIATDTLRIREYQAAARIHGALFVLDEVVTGFRYGMAGAQGYYGITADLATFSKGMANGYPLAAITGPRAIMEHFEDGRVFLSTTFGGEATALAACKATLETLRETDALERLHAYGNSFGVQAQELLEPLHGAVTLRGNAPRMVFDFAGTESVSADALRTLWLQELHTHGVLAGVPWFPMTCWNTTIVQQLVAAVEAAVDVMARVTSGADSLENVLRCPVIGQVFDARAGQQR